MNKKILLYFNIDYDFLVHLLAVFFPISEILMKETN